LHYIQLRLEASSITVESEPVPCGLPATVTSILTLVARRLANRNVYVKRLDICEALGQVSIIASDKTGTLTRNEMTEEHRKVNRADSLKAVLWAQSSLRGEPKHFNVSTINEEETIKSHDTIEKGIENSQQKKQHRPIVNKRSIKMSQKHSTAIGTPSEVAMLNYAAILINVHKCRQEYEDANCLIKKYLEINPSLYSCSN
uniref:P-type ATPase n=1 Tax=Meloidogyne floridensis TaxID=298350 RepID=A0A915P4S5_9BILA